MMRNILCLFVVGFAVVAAFPWGLDMENPFMATTLMNRGFGMRGMGMLGGGMYNPMFGGGMYNPYGTGMGMFGNPLMTAAMLSK